MLKKLFTILTLPERNRAGVLMVIILVMAFIDMLGVASILPFIAVLANPELVQVNTILNTAYATSHHIGIHTTEQFMLGLGVLVFVLLIDHLPDRQSACYIQSSTLCTDVRIQYWQATNGRLSAPTLQLVFKPPQCGFGQDYPLGSKCRHSWRHDSFDDTNGAEYGRPRVTDFAHCC